MKKMNKHKKTAAFHNGRGAPKAAKPAMAAAAKKYAETGRDKNPASGRPYFEVVDNMCGRGVDQKFVLNDQEKKLLDVQGVAIDLLLKAYNSMIELAAVRLECKLSNTRVTGVARELRELIKVMSVYDC